MLYLIELLIWPQAHGTTHLALHYNLANAFAFMWVICIWTQKNVGISIIHYHVNM